MMSVQMSELQSMVDEKIRVIEKLDSDLRATHKHVANTHQQIDQLNAESSMLMSQVSACLTRLLLLLLLLVLLSISLWN